MADVKETVEAGKKKLSRKQRTVIIAVVSVAAVALIVGVGFGVWAHADETAREQAQAAKVKKARKACDDSIDRLIKA